MPSHLHPQTWPERCDIPALSAIRPLLLSNVRVAGQPPFWESSPIPPSAMIGAKGLFEEGAHLSEVRRH